MGTVSSVAGISKTLTRAKVKSYDATQSEKELGVDLTEESIQGNARKQLKQLLLLYASVVSKNNEDTILCNTGLCLSQRPFL